MRAEPRHLDARQPLKQLKIVTIIAVATGRAAVCIRRADVPQVARLSILLCVPPLGAHLFLRPGLPEFERL